MEKKGVEGDDGWEKDSRKNLLDIVPDPPYKVACRSNDSPVSRFTSNEDAGYAHDTFTTWLMFRPAGDDSIFVPLCSVDWYWRGEAKLSNGNWTLTSKPDDCSKDPEGVESSTLPEWAQNTLGLVKPNN